MPYGCVIGGFPSNYFYIGDHGAFSVQRVDEGNPLQISLNMSSADHAAILGSFVVTAVRISGHGQRPKPISRSLMRTRRFRLGRGW